MFNDDMALTSLTLPDDFIIPSETKTVGIFSGIKRTAILYTASTTVRSIWPGVLGN
jgi:hypothetical protein